MLTIYLVRHAKSSWAEPELKDIDRPLNGRGKKNAPEIGKLLKKMNEIPDLIISSNAKRAMSTAKRIAAEIDYPVNNIVKNKPLYMAGKNEFLSVISNTESELKKLMLISHNPGITDFANYISNSHIENIPTAGIVKIDFDTNSWKEAAETKGKVIFFEYPKKHK